MIDIWAAKLDRTSPIPLYFQFKQLLLEDINAGRLKVDDMLPSELELCRILRLSRPTVRQALSTLTAEGYLERTKGKGTYIAHPKLEANFIQKLESLNAEMTRQGLSPRTEVIALDIQTVQIPAMDRLLLQTGDNVVHLERRCFASDEPVAYQISYLPASRFAALIYEDLTAHSLYSLLENRFGTVICHVHRQIEAVNANQATAERLMIPRDKAVSLVENIAYDTNELPVEYNISFYRGDRNKFTMEMHR